MVQSFFPPAGTKFEPQPASINQILLDSALKPIMKPFHLQSRQLQIVGVHPLMRTTPEALKPDTETVPGKQSDPLSRSSVQLGSSTQARRPPSHVLRCLWQGSQMVWAGYIPKSLEPNTGIIYGTIWVAVKILVPFWVP